MYIQSVRQLILLSIFLLFLYTQGKGQNIDPGKYFIPDEYKEDIFYDDYLTNQNNWILVIDERSFRKLENGYLNCWSYFTNDPKYWRSAFCLKRIDFDESKNFEIEAVLKCNQFGISPIPLIWGRNSETLKTLYFGFTSKGEFIITKFENNKFYDIKSLTKSTLINTTGFNKLTVRKFDNTLYFFINDSPVYTMVYAGFPGREFGFQAPSNSVISADYIRLSYIGDINYEKLVKTLSLKKYDKWLQKGKFERTIDYQSRVNNAAKNKMIASVTQDVIDSIGNSKTKFELLRNEYDSDNEMFTIYFKSQDSLQVSVPLKEAPSFDENFPNLIIKPRFTLRNNTFPLIYMEITNPGNKKVYAYRSSLEQYNINKIIPFAGDADTVIIPKDIIIREVARQQTYFQKNLSDYTNRMIETRNITENVKTNVTARVVEETDSAGAHELNYQLTYSYEVVRAVFENNDDDFPLGKYKVSNSNAAKITLNELQESVNSKLNKFLVPGAKVTIKITGSADATPIKSSIRYDGDFGAFRDANCIINDEPSVVNLNQNDGITTNEQLAFLRTYSVRQYIESNIEALKNTQNTFQHSCIISKDKGGQYRRISIEITIHKAFNGKMTDEIFAQTGIRPGIKSDVDTGIPETNVKNKSFFALIVGNENYKNEIKVPFAAHDADIFRQYCIQTFGIPENQVHYLENATFGQLQGEIKWLTDIIKAFKGEANIIVYYAGHGMPDEATKSPYILPVDGNSSIPETALSLDVFYGKLQENRTNSVTVFLDACFSGSSREGMITEGRGVVLTPVTNVLNNNIVVFGATTSEETALAYNDKEHGMFTYFLLKKIKESNGFFRYDELYDYIKTNVSQQSVLINQKPQTPSVNVSADVIDRWGSLHINE